MNNKLGQTITFLLLPIFLFGQSDKSYLHYFHFHPFAVFRGALKMGVEDVHNSGKNSFWISPAFIYSDKRDERKIGGSLEVQYRFNLDNPLDKESSDVESLSSHSLYVGPFGKVKYKQYHFTQNTQQGGVRIKTDFKDPLYIVSTGVVFGVKFQILDYLILDLYSGGQFRYAGFSPNPELHRNNLSFLSPGYSGILPKLGLTVSATF